METSSEDTEITLGTGKMLALFFGLVALCGVFFGMGYKVGKNASDLSLHEGLPPAATGPLRPAADKPATASTPSPDLTFYKSVEQNDANPQLTTPSSTPAAAQNTVSTAPSSSPAPTAPATATVANPNAAPAPPPVMGGYFVQVAAVTKQEDADALVDALKKKNYAAFSVPGPVDKLFHVQVGPFGDIKDAESTRDRLVSDGYNPIVKK
jgi:DedD protein